MAEKQVIAPVAESNEVVDRAKGFWAEFSKPIIYVGSAVILLVAGWIGYKSLIVEPKEVKAADVIFPAEQLFGKMTQTGFNKDSINLVLNGGNGIPSGVLKIASNYGGTTAGNRANFIAGACYLHSKDFNKAIKHLKDFSTDATQVQGVTYSMLGDAYSELKKNDEALDYYKKAAAVNTKDEFMTSEHLFKAAQFAEATGKTKEAIDLLQKIKAEYPASTHNADIDKNLARLGVFK
ncbi:MAG: tetratricopeptide repeat protein [Bacteroidota bacterium]|nr:tetratricopeptide repeat protein [Ferruginibacter sp.]